MTSTSTTLPAGGGVLFADGFESGSVGAWSSAVTSSGRLSVTSAAGLAGSFGLQARIVNASQMYVADATPSAAASFAVGFQFDPNSVVLGSKTHDVLRASSASGAVAVKVQLRAGTGGYQVRVGTRLANGSMRYSSWTALSDASHSIQISWVAASSSAVANGSLSWSIDGAAGQSLTSMANSTVRIDEVRLGPQGLSSGISGTEYYDTYTSSLSTTSSPPTTSTSSTTTLPPTSSSTSTTMTSTTTSTPTTSSSTSTSTTLPAGGGVLFADGFESGSVGAWSSAVTSSGRLSVTSAAGLAGSFGLQARIVNASQMYVADATPSSVASFAVGFQFDPNSVVLGSKTHDVLRASSASGAVAVKVQVRAATGGYQVRVGTRLASGSMKYSSWTAMSDASHSIQISWVAASSSAVANGSLSWSIDGAAAPSVINMANSTVRIDEVRLGPQGLSSGISGTEYYDTYTSSL